MDVDLQHDMAIQQTDTNKGARVLFKRTYYQKNHLLSILGYVQSFFEEDFLLSGKAMKKALDLPNSISSLAIYLYIYIPGTVHLYLWKIIS